MVDLSACCGVLLLQSHLADPSCPRRSSSEGTAAPAGSTAALPAPGRTVILGKVLQYLQLCGCFPLLPPASSPVNGPATQADAVALPMLQQPLLARSH